MRAALLAIMVLRHLRLWLLLLLRLLWLLWLWPGTTPLGATTRAVEPIGPTLGAATIRAARTTGATRIKVCAKSIGRVYTRTDPGASQVDRAEWAADGKTARTTLSEIVRMRNTTGQPSLDVTDIVQTGDHATATITVAFPGNWGSWTFPNSGFQYLDGKWKLQKSAVCSLAQASLTKCY